MGKSADACIETPDGYTTVAMGLLPGPGVGALGWVAERGLWALMQLEVAAEAELKQWGSAAPSPAAALREMQRAWIAYRDAACDYEESQWGGGTGAGPAAIGCMMTLTGRQALALEERLASRRARNEARRLGGGGNPPVPAGASGGSIWAKMMERGGSIATGR